MKEMHNFRELKVWQASMDLVVEIYQLTGGFPSDEKFGLISQIRRCAVSIPSNIAEGAGRNHNTEFRQFLGVATASSFELETQLILAQRLDMVENKAITSSLEKLTQIQKMTYNLRKSLTSSK